MISPTASPVGGEQDDPGAPDMRLGAVAIANQRIKAAPVHCR